MSARPSRISRAKILELLTNPPARLVDLLLIKRGDALQSADRPASPPGEICAGGTERDAGKAETANAVPASPAVWSRATYCFRWRRRCCPMRVRWSPTTSPPAAVSRRRVPGKGTPRVGHSGWPGSPQTMIVPAPPPMI